MRALAIDTTRKILVIVLIDGDKLYKKVLNESNKKHNSLLLPSIDELLIENNLEIKDIDCFSAVTGPGSFTGIRIGIATINGLAFALNKPVVEVNSFELIAYNVKGEAVCLIDALHGNCYGASVKDGCVTAMDFYESDSLPDGEKYYQNELCDYADELADIVKNKIKIKDFKERLIPLYLRKSQAEREAENASNS